MSRHDKLDAYHFYEQDWEDMEAIRESFHWECPEEFNLASYVCDRWADEPDRVAFHVEDPDGPTTQVTYADLKRRADRLAAFLRDAGVERGDRVGVCLPPDPAVAVAHVAAWKCGAVSVPLNTLFGPDAISYRLANCGVQACLTGPPTVDTVRDVADEVDSLETLVTVNAEARPGEVAYEGIQAEYDASVETVRTDPEEAACIIYTSGTTGDPKGVVHAHRFLLGVLPLMNRCFLFDNSTEDQVWWTPVGWSWVGTLSVVFAGLFFGVEIVAYDGGEFDPEQTFELLEKHDVTWFGGPPTMLRMMKDVEHPGERFDVGTLDVIGSGGGKIDQETVDWAAEVFDGATIQDTYGQTESGAAIIGDFAPVMPTRADSIGVAMPGNEVRIVDPETKEPVPTGEVGEIAVKYDGNLAPFLEYWQLPEKTARKVQDGWLYTEDLGTVDEDGYFTFETRADDVIISSGYKVSPEEIEETLAKHDRVADAGVIGVPHETRGEIPRAYVALDGASPDDPDALVSELQAFVKDTLAKYEYPREVTFIDDLPMTNTGKISRHDLRVRAGLADD